MDFEKYLEKNCLVLEYMHESFVEVFKTQPILMIEEIQKILQNHDTSDFMKVEQIVEVYEKYGVSTGGCHDF